MAPNLDTIKDFLARLDLSTSRIPTVAEYKKAYREKLKKHPDKGGDTTVFQGITEAAMAVWKYMVEHQDQQHRAESDKDSTLLRTFESSNNVNYNKGSVVFDIEGGKAQLWIDSLQKRVGPPMSLADGSGVRMKIDHFKIPLVTCKTKQEYGSLSITVYPNPKTSHPKIMVQGQAYLAFVSLVLPEVIKDMIAPRPAIGIGTAAATPALTSDCDSDTEDQPNIELLHNTEEQHGTRSLDITPSDMLQGPTNTIMQQAFSRLEHEMVNIRTSLAAKVDAALINISRLNTQGLDTKIEALEHLMTANLKKTEELQIAVTDLSANIKDNSDKINIDNSQIDKLASCVASHPTLSLLSTSLSTLRTEVAQSTTLLQVQSGVKGLSDTLITLETEVKNINQKITDTNEASNKDMAQIRKNSDDSLGVFNAMKKSLETLVNQAVNPDLPTTSHLPPNPSPNIPNQQNKPSDNTNNRIRRGIMFTDSIAVDLDPTKLKHDLNCDLKVVPTNFIHHHPSSADPDAYLQCMVDQHLAGKTCYDFAIIAVGANDITEMDIESSPPTTLTNSVADQTKVLVQVAETLATENNLDIFLVDKPPRYDLTTRDSMGMLAKLSKYANGVLASSVGMTPRLSIIDQSSLARSSLKARSDIYKPDGLHLTPKGLTFYTANVTRALQELYPDMAVPKQTVSQEQSRQPNTGSPPRQDRTQGRGGRRDRPYQDWPGYGYAGPVGQFHHPPYPDYPPPPPPGWHGGNWGGNRQQRQPRPNNHNWDSGRNVGYSGGYSRGYGRRN